MHICYVMMSQILKLVRDVIQGLFKLLNTKNSWRHCCCLCLDQTIVHRVIIVLQMKYFMIQMGKRLFTEDSGNTLSKRDFKGINLSVKWMLSSGTQQRRIYEHMRDQPLSKNIVLGAYRLFCCIFLLFVFLGGNVSFSFAALVITGFSS